MWDNITEEETKVLKLMIKSSADFYKFFITQIKNSLDEGEGLDDAIREIVDSEDEIKLLKLLLTTDILEKIKKI